MWPDSVSFAISFCKVCGYFIEPRFTKQPRSSPILIREMWAKESANPKDESKFDSLTTGHQMHTPSQTWPIYKVTIIVLGAGGHSKDQ